MRTQKVSARAAFTLIELLLTITIILLLISLLLPALNRGHHSVKRIQCANNLHQAGLGFVSFAHGHEDRFPIQVSTNQGGSAEFVQAGNMLQGPFYFSYKHFVPLAGELQEPSLLVCPTDNRPAATNFSSMNNSNLSYFTSLNPQSGDSTSIVAGDRNVSASTNTIVRLGPRRGLRWTGEMHQYRGNVLFADAHVEQMAEFLSISNKPGAALTSLALPSVPEPLPAPGLASANSGGGGGSASGSGSGSVSPGNARVSFPAPVSTNFNAPFTNLPIGTKAPDKPLQVFVSDPPVGPSGSLPIPNFNVATQAPPGQTQHLPAASAPAPEPTMEQEVAAAHDDMVQTGKQLGRQGTRYAYGLPWWAILGLLLACLWLLKRAHDRTKKSPAKSARPPDFYYSKTK